jgi:hypothetical protein
MEGRSSPDHQWEVGMTWTDVEALSGPQATGTAANRRGSSRAARRLMVLPVALLLAIALAAPTLAATSKEGLSGYSTKPNSGTSPSKTTKAPTTSTPAKETAPATSSSVPTTTTTSPKASSLPFTGFDLRWTVGAGLLLMGMGFSIVTAQRRQGRDSGH